MSEWSRIPLRQLKKSFGVAADIPQQLQSFLTMVSETYDHYERERKMLERSIELSSAEMKKFYCSQERKTSQ